MIYKFSLHFNFVVRKSKSFLYNLLMENKIKYYRKLNNFTQEEMATKLNVTRQSYINYESGETEPSFETLKQISKILNTSIDLLLDNKEFIAEDKIKSDSILKDIKDIVAKYSK